MATKVNLVIDQGADFSTNITLKEDDGTFLDLSNYTGASQLRRHYTSTTSTAFTLTLGGNTGTVTMAMNASTTGSLTAGRYVYDLELTDDGGAVSRIVEGIATVTPNVTRS